MPELSFGSLIEFSLSQDTFFGKLKSLMFSAIFYRKLKCELSPSKQNKSVNISDFSDDVYPLF